MRLHFKEPTNTLSARTMNALAAAGLTDAEQIRARVVGRGLGRRPPNIGKKSTEEIIRWLDLAPSGTRIEPRDSLKRALRLQHLADRALRISQRHQSLSRRADHHFRRYLKLLKATLDAWQTARGQL